MSTMYSLGALTWCGDHASLNERPWYIAEGDEAKRFCRFLHYRDRPPQTAAERNEFLQVTFRLCQDNPAFFLHEFGEIKLGEGGTGPFNQWSPGQRKLYLSIQSQRSRGKPVRSICLKARREGVSTLWQGLDAWLIGFHPFRNGLIAAQEDSASKTLFGMVSRFLDCIPKAFQAARVEDSKSAIEFAAPLGGRIEHRTVAPGGGSKANAGKGRGNALQILHAAEASRWDEPETFWNGVASCVEDYPETYIGIESTANSFGWFKEMWDEAAAGWDVRFEKGVLRWVCVDPTASRSDLVPVFLSWLEEPKYALAFDTDADRKHLLGNLDPDEKDLRDSLGATLEQLHWRRRTLWGSKFKGDLSAFREEFPATPSEAFRSSGRKVFDMMALDAIERRIRNENASVTRWRVGVNAEEETQLVPAEDGEIAVWVPPVEGHEYAIGVDGSYGKSKGDWMCAQVLDMGTWEQVAGVRVRASNPDEFGEMVDVLGRFYRGGYDAALAVIEVNGPGLAVLKVMERLEYSNFYFRTVPDDATGQPKKTFGWWTSDKTRRWMVSELCQAVRLASSGEGVKLHDLGTVEEMRDWVLKVSSSGKVKEQPSSPKGYDDRITALGLALVGGALENGEGAPIVSHPVGNAKDRCPGERYDEDAGRLLRHWPAARNRWIYDPVTGANP